MISSRAVEAIEASDTDELVRVVDSYCAARSWDLLVELRHRCREAVGRGKQLWGVEEHIRYRLALEAPPAWAGPVVSEGRARFAPGPLAEVAASTKTWAEMRPHLEPGPEGETFAAERVVRGETGVDPIPDLPARLEAWEPRYPVATYKRDKVEAPSPPLPVPEPTTLPSAVNRISDPASEGALSDLVQPWVEESNGRCDTASVEGDAAAAVRALGVRQARMTPLSPQTALAWMGWAGASGGAHGRRRGAAAGRYGAWWVLASLADLDWPPQADKVGRVVQRLRWFWFDNGSPGTGWQLRLAVEDPETGLAWSVAAVDAPD